MTITEYPTRIHSAFNPILIKGTKEEGEQLAQIKVAIGNYYSLPENHMVVEREFFNDEAVFNISQLISGFFENEKNTTMRIIRNKELSVEYSVFRDDDIHLYRGIAINAVSQLGHSVSMVSYLGYFLTKFDKIITYENYEREIYAVSFEQADTYLFVDGYVVFSVSNNFHFGCDVGDSVIEIALANSGIDRFLRNNLGQVITDNFGEPIEIMDDENGIHRRLTVERRCTPRNPFYVRWINDLGGIDYWMFGKKQITRIEIENSETFEPYVENTETATENIIPINLSATESVTIGTEELTENEFEVISKIIYSPKIEMLDKQTNKWLRIIPDKSDVKNDTSQNPKSIELKFTLPKPYLQF